MRLGAPALLRSTLSALHYSGADRLAAGWTRGVGVIFMLHHVRPPQERSFAPNRILEITPAYLDLVIGFVVDQGFEVVALDDAHARLSEGDFDRPFACFTFDDGYRDNRQHAHPIFRRYGLPYTVYVPGDFPDGTGDLWWLKLERVIGSVDRIELRMNGVLRSFDCSEPGKKYRAFDTIYWWVRALPELECRHLVNELCRRYDVDVDDLCRDLVMTWDELRSLAADPLVTIGAHTRRHMAVGKLNSGEAQLEIVEGRRRLEVELGRPVHHFAFPYGDATSAGQRDFILARELGFKTAVTTRKGLIHRHHTSSMHSLPRLSLNGDYQNLRYLKVMLSGLPFAIWNLTQHLPGPLAAR